jgi:Rieske 2Fe-2S family protein
VNSHDLINIKHVDFPQARSEMYRLLAARKGNLSLPQPLYNDPHMFKVDMQEIFQKEWIFVGMSCELPDKGDYITVDIGQNSILIVRDADANVSAFHNVCRHRGSKICDQQKGKVANLVCPYHQWTYDLKGNLLFAGTEMGSAFDLKQHGLKPTHCQVAGGFIFVCLALGDAPDIAPLTATLDEYMAPYDIENTKVAAQTTIEETANWKLVLENNRECYHCNASHPELLDSLLEWDDTDDPRASPEFIAHCEQSAKAWEAEDIPHKHVTYGLKNRIVRMPLKEGTSTMTADGGRACDKLMGRIQNPQLGSMRVLHLPNSWNHMQSDHCVVFQVIPISAQKTLVTTKWLVHKDAQEGVDYNIDRLTHVWNATNEQDKILAERNQQGINSIGYQPGPYSETYEFGVINFVDWYSETIRNNIDEARQTDQ